MAAEDDDRPAGVGIPDSDRAIEAPGREPGPIRTERDRIDAAGRRVEPAVLLAGGGVPDPHPPIGPAEAISLPEGWNATQTTPCSCPRKTEVIFGGC